MQIGSAHFQGLVEHRLEEPDYGRTVDFSLPLLGARPVLLVDDAFEVK